MCALTGILHILHCGFDLFGEVVKLPFNTDSMLHKVRTDHPTVDVLSTVLFDRKVTPDQEDALKNVLG